LYLISWKIFPSNFTDKRDRELPSKRLKDYIMSIWKRLFRKQQPANPETSEATSFESYRYVSEKTRKILREVQDVLENKGDVNVVDKVGCTPLHRAVELTDSNQIKLAKQLVEAGAEVNVRDNAGSTPLQDINYYDQNSSYEVLELLLTKGADPNPNTGQFTPLGNAAHCQAVRAAELLIRHKADVNGRSEYDYTPLHMALQTTHTEIQAPLIRLLLKSGADLTLKDTLGRTPIFPSCLTNNLEIAMLLFKKKVEVNTRDNMGMTVLHNAARYGHMEMLEFLLKAGADPNIKTNYGDTPLMYAEETLDDEADFRNPSRDNIRRCAEILRKRLKKNT
jgi:ankyrin repeat protein